MGQRFRKRANIAKNYVTGKLRCAEFAITNACIAKCTFCDIWKQRPKVFTDKGKTLRAIDRLSELGVSHMTFTGGEPLLHPDIISFVERATSNRINNSVLAAAPRLVLRDDTPARLEQAGCDLLCLSFDSGDPKTMAASRGIDGIMADMELAIEAVKRTRLKTMASVLIWNDNYDRLGEVCQSALGMGFDFISFNYPTFSLSGVYELGGEGVSLPRESVADALEAAIELKRSNKYPIVNSVVSMRNIIDYLRGPGTARFPCHGGRRVFFVDWFFDVRPCMQLPDVLGNVLSIEGKDLCRAPCNQCSMSWYRDFSTLFCGARSAPALFEGLSRSGGLL